VKIIWVVTELGPPTINNREEVGALSQEVSLRQIGAPTLLTGAGLLPDQNLLRTMRLYRYIPLIEDQLIRENPRRRKRRRKLFRSCNRRT
jgi:hypothetical protein